MPVSCSRCNRLGLSATCKVASKSDSCGHCVAANNHSCNVHGNDPAALRKVLDEKKRLDAEERDTLAKLLRLKDQQKSLAQRAEELFGHEIDIMQEEARQERETVAPTPAFDWGDFAFEEPGEAFGGSPRAAAAT